MGRTVPPRNMNVKGSINLILYAYIWVDFCYRVIFVKCKKVLSFYSLMLHLHDLDLLFSFSTMLMFFVSKFHELNSLFMTSV